MAPGWGYQGIVVGDLARVNCAALNGKIVWCAGRVRQRFMKAKTRAVFGGVLKGRVGGYGYVSASSHTGQAKVECNFGQEARVWERTGQR